MSFDDPFLRIFGRCPFAVYTVKAVYGYCNATRTEADGHYDEYSSTFLYLQVRFAFFLISENYCNRLKLFFESKL